jgi:hypothetical protein
VIDAQVFSVSRGVSCQAVECVEHPFSPFRDWIGIFEQSERAYCSGPLKAAEHNVVGVKGRLAAEERLRLERLTQRLQALPET